MKRAASHPISALFLELYVILDDPHDIGLPPKVVNKGLGVSHYLLAQFYNSGAGAALIGWRLSKTRDVWVSG